MFDYCLVGAGLFNATLARLIKKNNKDAKIIVVEKRNHIAGNIYDERIENINVHKYGAHIFHTSDMEVWKFVNEVTDFNRFTNSPIANYKGEIYNLPFNMNTFVRMWGITTVDEAREIINNQRKEIKWEPRNLEEQAISLVGRDIYEKLIKGYTEKQWGRDCKDLPAFIIKRIPVRYTFDNNYFNDSKQGLPLTGYTKMVEKMFEGCDIDLDTDYLQNKDKYKANVTVYTGAIDEYYDYKFGELNWRSLKFEEEILHKENFQGNAVVNYTEREIPYTRIIEHKHFLGDVSLDTVITKEYPMDWSKGLEKYYPMNDDKNQELYNKYKDYSQKDDIIFGGRLGMYKYYDMDKVIRAAMDLYNENEKFKK